MSDSGEATRQRVMDAAIALLDQKGWNGFTIHAIARKSRVSLGSLYHHFGSVNGIAAAAWSRSMTRLLTALSLACARASTPRSAVRALVLGYLDFTEQRRAEALFIHASSWASFLPEHASALADDKAKAFAPLLETFGGFVETGSLVDVSPPMLELLLIGPAAETARRWLAGVPGVSLPEARAVLPEAAWKAVRRGELSAADARPTASTAAPRTRTPRRRRALRAATGR